VHRVEGGWPPEALRCDLFPCEEMDALWNSIDLAKSWQSYLTVGVNGEHGEE